MTGFDCLHYAQVAKQERHGSYQGEVIDVPTGEGRVGEGTETDEAPEHFAGWIGCTLLCCSRICFLRDLGACTGGEVD